MDRRLERKTLDGARLTPDEGLYLLTRCDLHTLARLATHRRRAAVGEQVYFQHNLNLNYTNVCTNRCPLCAFHRTPEAGYVLAVPAVVESVRKGVAQGVREVHVVGGLNPALPYSYYLDLVSSIRGVDPDVRVQGYTAVEIEFMSRVAKKTTAQVLADLKAAGLTTLPGGGAEIFSTRVRDLLCPNKISGREWLRIHEEAHGMGLRTNATMLYGHVETPIEIIDHLEQLRSLQDRTHGFAAFVPLAFYAANTRVEGTRPETFGELDMRVIAASRLFLDNFLHVKSLWMTLGYKAFQVGLEFGADDMGATYYDELIVHSAGARTPRGLTQRQLRTLAERIGRTPVETYSDYTAVPGTTAPTARGQAPGTSPAVVPSDAASCAPTARGRAPGTSPAGGGGLGGSTRPQRAEGVRLLSCADTWELGERAHAARLAAVPGDRVTYVIDRIINVTNVCTSGCSFCAFHVPPGSSDGYVLTVEQVVAKARELVQAGGTQVMIQGGLHPTLGIEYYETLLREMKKLGLYVHCLSAAEVLHLARMGGLTVRQALQRLQAAGLDSLPGGGAEILVDSVRGHVSPRKLTTAEWTGVMREVAALGMQATATMVFGGGESLEERVAHLDVVRTLQDETRVFRAFIPWTYALANTGRKDEVEAGGAEYLRMLAVSRLYLDNIPHIGSGWLSEGMRVAQLGLRFGADDMGGVLMEEKVLHAAGGGIATNEKELREVIRAAGFVPARRNTLYQVVEDQRQ